MQARFAQEAIRWIEVDLAADASATVDLPEPAPDDIAFLQYTSGSTSEPKGVMVSHANLLANLEMIRLALGNTRQSTYVNWVPLYHDMGLILNALQALYVGALCVLMAPNAFMQRPLDWLRAISHYRAEVGVQPQFRFRPLRQPLSRRADAGHRPVLAGRSRSTAPSRCMRKPSRGSSKRLRRTASIRARCFRPMAWRRRRLLISGGRVAAGHVTRTVSRAALQAHVGGGAGRSPTMRRRWWAAAARLPASGSRSSNRNSRTRLPADRVGEIWVSGPNIARAYWRNEAATHEGLSAEIAGEDAAHWLRTGDLGFLDATGELFVTGRIKDLIIIRGINHYPQDIERTVQSLDPALRQNCGAAFSVPDESGEETLVIVQEIERTARHRIDPAEIKGLIRESDRRQHEFSARHIALIRPGALPKTTSGKIQRKPGAQALARRQFRGDRLSRLTAQKSILAALADHAGSTIIALLDLRRPASGDSG